MLEHLGGLIALKRLNLSSNRLQTLDGLWLRNAHISAEDGDRPRRVGLRKLTYLHLAGNLIDKLDGLRLDEMANSLPSLRSLYLQNFDRSLQNGVCRKNGYKESVLARLPNLSNLDGERDPRASSYHQVAAEVEGLIANPPPRVEIVLPSPSPWITDEDLRPVERSIEAEFESKVKKVVRSIDDCHALFEVVKSEIGKAQSRIFSSSSAN